nr:hypothetical protein Itr_chr08CG12810 [Ipomoea trifida]
MEAMTPGAREEESVVVKTEPRRRRPSLAEKHPPPSITVTSPNCHLALPKPPQRSFTILLLAEEGEQRGALHSFPRNRQHRHLLPPSCTPIVPSVTATNHRRALRW